MSDGGRSGSWPSAFGHRFDVEWPRLLAFALGVLVIGTLTMVAATSTATFDPFNPSWNGTADLRDQVESDPDVESELMRQTGPYKEVDPSETVAIVVAPDDTYTGTDADRVESFVADGGTLVVFENFGDEGNTLLESVGAATRVDGQLLRDEQYHYRGPKMPVATGVENHSVTRNSSQLTLNHATAVDPVSNETTVLVTTSDVASLGDEGDPIENGTIGAHPVATAEPVGDGRVIVVGDPSITINAMLSRPDNAAFVRGLYADETHVLLDISHVDDPPVLALAMETVRTTPQLQALFGTVGIAIIAALSGHRVTPFVTRVANRFSSRARSQTIERTLSDDSLTTEERMALLRRRRHHSGRDEEQTQRVRGGRTGIQSDRDTDERERSKT